MSRRIISLSSQCFRRSDSPSYLLGCSICGCGPLNGDFTISHLAGNDIHTSYVLCRVPQHSTKDNDTDLYLNEQEVLIFNEVPA